MDINHLSDTIRLFEFYKSLAEKALIQIDEEDFFWKYNEDSNSIANIVKHLSGNMLSRWTNFLQADGEKSWRDRDSEFTETLTNKNELLKNWEEGWSCLFSALKSLKADDLKKTIYIRNQAHSVIQAINRQLAHYPYHIGQIIFICKMRSIQPWQTLSISKGNSDQYNSNKFAQEKSQTHFTEEYLEEKKISRE